MTDKKVFDWIKAAEIIRDRNVKDADAGLYEEWSWTGGIILKEGKPFFDSYTYLASKWATPILQIGEEKIPCFTMESAVHWKANTKWPKKALEILAKGGGE